MMNTLRYLPQGRIGHKRLVKVSLFVQEVDFSIP